MLCHISGENPCFIRVIIAAFKLTTIGIEPIKRICAGITSRIKATTFVKCWDRRGMVWIFSIHIQLHMKMITSICPGASITTIP